MMKMYKCNCIRMACSSEAHSDDMFFLLTSEPQVLYRLWCYCSFLMEIALSIKFNVKPLSENCTGTKIFKRRMKLLFMTFLGKLAAVASLRSRNVKRKQPAMEGSRIELARQQRNILSLKIQGNQHLSESEQQILTQFKLQYISIAA